MVSERRDKVPPDGGYGWIVTVAYALNNVVVLPLIAGFGLVFQSAFSDTGITHTQGALIITLNHGIGMLLSFFGGPVLSRFGYRKVAVVGALLISAGLMMTAGANSFWMFLFSYSIINSMGVAAVMAAFTLAINSYFKEKRGRAIGAGMSLTGLGAICMPLVMSLLMYEYGWRYAVLILGAICLHSLVGACLLRPVKWYLKYPVIVEEMVPLNENGKVELISDSVATSKAEGEILTNIEESVENGTVPPRSLSVRSLVSITSLQKKNSISHPDIRKKPAEPPLSESRYKWWESQEINLGSSINIFHEHDKKERAVKRDNSKIVEEVAPKSLARKFVDFFDLTLLSDPIFVNILIGLSLAGCVETNFTLLLPMILRDMMKFSTEDIAKVMSVIAFSDTVFRFISPFIGEWCHKSPRYMYMVSLLSIIFIRTIMLFTTSYLGMIFLAIAMGLSKGVRTVYMNIVIPSYVPIERLPFASGIQMFCNGIVIITIGSLLGRVRESSGAYKIPIIILNVVTMLAVLLWAAEFVYLKAKSKPSATAKTDAIDDV